MTAAFPFTPNWRVPVQETLAYKTEIISSRSGREQRRALRKSPRRSFELMITAMPSRYAAFKNFLAQYRRQEIALPDPTRHVKTTALVEEGDTAFSVVGTRSWLVDGALVCFSENGRAEVREIATVDGTDVVLTTPVDGDWLAGSKLRPALLGRLAPEFSGTSPVPAIAEASVRFLVTPASETSLAIPAAGATFGGRELVTLKPNFRQALEIGFLQPQDDIDYDFGKVESFFPVDFSTRSSRAGYLARTAAEMTAIKDIFMRARGQQGEFYMPTWEPDLVAKVPLTIGQTALRVAGTEVASAYAASTVNKAVYVRTPDGASVQSRGVGSITANAGDSLVNLALALPFTVDEDTLISWLPVHRFVSDELTVTWHNEEVAETSFGVMTLEDLA